MAETDIIEDFTVAEVFRRLNGETFTNQQELRRRLDKFILANLGRLPPEFGTDDLMRIGGDSDFYIQKGDSLRIKCN